MKKKLILLVTLSFLILSGGCTNFTSELYRDGSLSKVKTYTEEISTFLITQDGKQLIVVGKEHHYIFEANDTLKFILTWPEKKRVKAEFGNGFSINPDQIVTGSYTLTVDAERNLTQEAGDLLISKGFQYNTTKKTLSYTDKLQGKRYLADKFKLPSAMQLNQKYTIPMYESYLPATNVVKRILLTPLAVVGDGVSSVVYLGGMSLMYISNFISGK